MKTHVVDLLPHLPFSQQNWTNYLVVSKDAQCSETCMQKQFSDLFTFNKNCILSFWYLEIFGRKRKLLRFKYFFNAFQKILTIFFYLEILKNMWKKCEKKCSSKLNLWNIWNIFWSEFHQNQSKKWGYMGAQQSPPNAV